MEVPTAWKHAIDYYEELFDEGADILPQLELTRRASQSKYGKVFFPISYAHALNISPTVDYSESLERPSISIRYKGNNKFEVSYLNDKLKSGKTTKTVCDVSQVWSLLESLFLRLEIESDKTSG